MTVPKLPLQLGKSKWTDRVCVAIRAAESAGAALLSLRGQGISGREVGGQLKTAADEAAEGWVVGYLRSVFPQDEVLAEERHERDAASGASWSPRRAFWVVDALDGTRSYVDGFSTFCVQIAWVVDGTVRLGVVHEPVAGVTYVGAAGAGAYRLTAVSVSQLEIPQRRDWPAQPRFIDSTRPTGSVADLMRTHNGVFVECGSIGLKLCRVADGSADVFIKALRFKLWDVAPAHVILTEAGGDVRLWSGDRIPFTGHDVVFRDILAAASPLVSVVVAEIRERARD